MNGILARLDLVERQLRALQREVDELRGIAAAAEQPEPVAAPAPAPEPGLVGAPPPEAPEPELKPWEQPISVRLGLPQMPRIEPADLLGARTLAWAGGIVTLLGVVLLFGLAVNRGWIGPVERVAFGALASTAAVAAGFLVRSRYGQYYSALGAVGAGIAGGYTTLLAAVALYELVPQSVALLVAAAIGAVGVAISLLWTAEIVAALGLVGATVAPAALAVEDGISPVGTGFAGIVFAATAGLAVWQRWPGLLVAGLVASLPQAATLVANEGTDAHWGVLVLALGFGALYLASGVARQLTEGPERLDRLATGLVLVSATFAAGSAAALLTEDAFLGVDRRGLVLLAIGVAYGGLAAAFFPRRDTRDLSALLSAAALTIGAIALADLLGGLTLAIVWAAEASALAWIARLVRDLRFRVSALAYLGLALGHVLAYDAPLTLLYRAVDQPADRLPALLAVVAAALLAALALRGPEEADEPGGGAIGDLLGALAEIRDGLRAGLVWLAGVFAAFAAALGTLALVRLADVPESFDWGRMGATALGALTAAALLVIGAHLERTDLLAGGVVWLAVVTADMLAFDLTALEHPQRSYAVLAVATGALAGGVLIEVFSRRETVGYACVALSGILAAVTIVDLAPSGNPTGNAFLGAAAAYLVLAAVLFRGEFHRDMSTLLWGIGLTLSLPASLILVDGTALVGAWTVTAVVLGTLAVLLGEGRLQVPAVVFGVMAGLASLFVYAPPSELFVENADPAEGAPAVALVALAALALALLARPGGLGGGDRFDEWLDDSQNTLRVSAAWTTGVAALYGVSLAILGAVAWLGGADLETEFQRGHTAVSALWGAVGLAALYLGLRRGGRSLQLAGFGLFGVSLVKIFLYDLSQLSSVARAVSFLAVGAILLTAGFFYQRLSGRDSARTE